MTLARIYGNEARAQGFRRPNAESASGQWWTDAEHRGGKRAIANLGATCTSIAS